MQNTGREGEEGDMGKRRAEGGLHCGQIKVLPYPMSCFSLPSRRPCLGCIWYLFLLGLFSLWLFSFVGLAPDGLYAKGKQRGLSVLWVWGLKTALDTSCTLLSRCPSTMCHLTITPLFYPNLYLDPTLIPNMPFLCLEYLTQPIFLQSSRRPTWNVCFLQRTNPAFCNHVPPWSWVVL